MSISVRRIPKKSGPTSLVTSETCDGEVCGNVATVEINTIRNTMVLCDHCANVLHQQLAFDKAWGERLQKGEGP